jgi:hypothetical protein
VITGRPSIFISSVPFSLFLSHPLPRGPSSPENTKEGGSARTGVVGRLGSECKYIYLYAFKFSSTPTRQIILETPWISKYLHLRLGLSDTNALVGTTYFLHIGNCAQHLCPPFLPGALLHFQRNVTIQKGENRLFTCSQEAQSEYTRPWEKIPKIRRACQLPTYIYGNCTRTSTGFFDLKSSSRLHDASWTLLTVILHRHRHFDFTLPSSCLPSRQRPLPS